MPIRDKPGTMADQLKSGKLRYVGISDAPPWKVAPAQTMAHFHGWNPPIALRIEYSLPGWGVLVRVLHPHFSTGKRASRHLLPGLSLALIGNASGQTVGVERISIRGVFD